MAIERGYLRNLEERKGRQARLVLGEPLPEDIAVLPAVDTLAARVEGCAVAAAGGEMERAPTVDDGIAGPPPPDDWEIF